MKGALQVYDVACPSLVGNPLGDPTTRATPIYVPAGYSSESAALPVMYFLHGFSGSGVQWSNYSAFTSNVPERLDALISAGKMPPVLGVFVDGWSALGGAQWINSEGIGRYADMLANDVVGWVDSHFKTIRAPEGRAVLGKSSGGFGSLSITKSHPGVFGHVACHSGDAAFEYCYLHELPMALGPIMKAGGIEKWFRDFVQRAQATQMRGDDHVVINMLCMAAAYSPNPGAPLNLELPVDLSTGQLNVALWEKWLAHDPLRFVPLHLDSFRRLKSLFIDCGTRDEFNLRWGARMLSQLFKTAGVDHLHEEFEDGHRGVNYRFERSMVWLSQRMATPASTAK